MAVKPEIGEERDSVNSSELEIRDDSEILILCILNIDRGQRRGRGMSLIVVGASLDVSGLWGCGTISGVGSREGKVAKPCWGRVEKQMITEEGLILFEYQIE